MATMAQPVLPPLPPDLSKNVPASPNAAGTNLQTGLGGGSPILDAIKKIESGYQELVQLLPSIAPVAAEAISKLRIVMPSAAGAGAGGGLEGGENYPTITGSAALPPPQGGQ